MPFSGFPSFGGFQLFSLAGLLMLATAVVQIFFAVGVKNDAEARFALGQPILFVPPKIWGLAVLLGGVPTLLIYWLFHHAFPRSQP